VLWSAPLPVKEGLGVVEGMAETNPLTPSYTEKGVVFM
jgi:hypothetical protein